MIDLKINKFDSIKHIDKNGNEFWYARELQIVLEYKEWRNFQKVIDKAITSTKNSNNIIDEHFVEVNRVLVVGNKAKMKVNDYKLSRYACYLIAQNGDSRKKSNSLSPNIFCHTNKKTRVIRKRL